ncbi:MAG: FlgD immunoglobulin-like domain containing protein [Candidatus Eisenbacteria bacterium]
MALVLFATLIAAAHAFPALAAPDPTAAESRIPVELQGTPRAQHPADLFGIRGDVAGLLDGDSRSGTMDTLWIFDADFEDLLGDNAGWTSLDMSGTLGHINYWHKDTIRTGGFPHLGDSAWWCGSQSVCWDQPRGYGNDWLCHLAREFPLSVWSDPGDNVAFEWDQRFAIENNYDYGYVDVLPEGASEWVTLATFDNPGFAGTPGTSTDWDHVTYGHWSLDMSAYAGVDVTVRFRLESDGANSSQDSPDSSPMHPFRDGAWQLDNFELAVDDTSRWFDDCESPGGNGWAHEDIPTTGQTGVVFRRTYCPETFRTPTCESVLRGWWMAALDSVSGRMVDGQASWLVSPPINVSGAEHLIGEWTFWQDCPRESEDIYDISLASSDIEECVRDLDEFVDTWAWSYDGAYQATRTDDWDEFAGKEWIAINWQLWNIAPAYPGWHWTGFMLDRQRVGVPTGEPGTTWRYSAWSRFNDWFVEQMAEALEDSAIIDVRDDDDIVSVTLVATNGITTTSYPCRRFDPRYNDWNVPPPTTEIVPGAEIRYYFEATDGAGNTCTHPKNAPEAYYEFSILPIMGSVADPAVLLVDKHGRTTPGEDRRHRHTSERYFREALDILGFEYDVFDVNVPSGSILSDGPDSSGMKYYDTQIWFTNEFDAYTIREFDQRNLIEWLGESLEGKERNLLLTGNDIGYELIQNGKDTLGFYEEWLATEYVQNSAGTYEDTMPVLRDAAGGFDFMTFDDRECHLWDALCPWPYYYDVVQPDSAAEGAELVAEYVTADMAFWPAGVAYTHPTMAYQTVNLGFGIEFMVGDLLPNGHYTTGCPDRVDLMANIMEYFGKTPTGPPTGADESVFANRLDHARPNPFNPRTTIEYSVAVPGRMTLRIYDLAGRAVRTLVDRDVEAGAHKIVWDGTTDAGWRAASGVYFLKMEARGPADAFRANRKLVLLK